MKKHSVLLFQGLNFVELYLYPVSIKSSKMKLLTFSIIVLITTTLNKASSQDSIQQVRLSQLLTKYYDIKNALVAGKADLVSASAEEFIKLANSIDYKLISEGNINALLKDASPISETKDIQTQRKHFANFSNNIAVIARSMKLTDKAVYLQYCPMKKAVWLSDEKPIKNPYYGNAMLTCGEVKETINH
jgi:hypothetical protein